MKATKKKFPISDRERKRIARIRRDPGGRFALEVGRYLQSKGWSVLMTTGASIHGTGKKGSYDLCIGFVGREPERRAEADDDLSEASKGDRRGVAPK